MYAKRISIYDVSITSINITVYYVKKFYKKGWCLTNQMLLRLLFKTSM